MMRRRTRRGTTIAGAVLRRAGGLLLLGLLPAAASADGRALIERPATGLSLRAVRVAELPVRRAASAHFVLEWTEREVTGKDAGVPATGLAGRPALPRAWALAQNYPNPFNPSTTIAFEIPDAAGIGDARTGGADAGRERVSLAVYDIRGRRVRVLIDADLEPGRHVVAWDGRDDRGAKAASGVYLYTLRAGGRRLTRKMSISK